MKKDTKLIELSDRLGTLGLKLFFSKNQHGYTIKGEGFEVDVKNIDMAHQFADTHEKSMKYDALMAEQKKTKKPSL